MVTEHCPEAGHSSGLIVSPPPLHHGVQQPSLRTPADGIPHLAGIRARLLTGGPSIQPAGSPPPQEPSTNPWKPLVCWCS